MDQFPLPEEGGAVVVGGDGMQPAKTQMRGQRKLPASSAARKQGGFHAIYSQGPTPNFVPGGVPVRRRPLTSQANPGAARVLGGDGGAAPSAAMPARDPSTIRSPDALINFGTRFRSQALPAPFPEYGRSRSRSSLGRSVSGGSLGRSASGASLQSASGFSSASSLVSGTQRAPSRGGRRVGSAPFGKPKPPIVPLIAPVPEPLFATGADGRSQYGHLQPHSGLGLGPKGPSMRYSQSTLRLLIAEMMMGLQDEHGDHHMASSSTLGGSRASSLSRF